jgi:predicted murein hydrolase (TIGR00659 family)
MSTLSNSPLVPLALTISTFAIAQRINKRFGGHPLVNPVLISVAFLILLLVTLKIPFQRYAEGTQFLQFLLGPAVVALAVPLYRHRTRIFRMGVPILVGVATGTTTAVLSVYLLGTLCGLDKGLIASLAPRTATAPVALGTATAIGGDASLAAVFAVMSGMIGAALGPAFLNRLGLLSPLSRGIAMGTASHGQGTARILQEGEEAGAYASLAMALTALLVAFGLPLLALIVH